MDRFIDKAAVMYIWQFGVFKIQYGQIYSNRQHKNLRCCGSLKSNMDRFIGSARKDIVISMLTLKSNMDRFIETSV